MLPRHSFAPLLALPLTALAQSPATGPAPATPAAMKTAVATRLTQLSNLRVTYAEEWTQTPPDELKNAAGQQIQPGIVIGPIGDSTQHHLITLSFLRTPAAGLELIESKPDPAHPDPPDPANLSSMLLQQEFAFPDYVEGYIQETTRNIGSVSASEKDFLDRRYLMDLALGLRLQGEATFLDPAHLDDWQFAPDKSGAFHASKNFPAGTLTLTFDPRLQNALTRIRAANPDGIPFFTLDASDFRPVNNLLLPFSAKLVAYSIKDNERHASQTYTLSVSTYTLNDPTNTEASHHLHWPDGTLGYDDRKIPPHFYVDQSVVHQINGEEYLRLESAQRATATTHPTNR